MNFIVTSTQEELRARIRKFVEEEIAIKASEFDESGDFPWRNVKLLSEKGLFGIFVPRQYGGSELDPISICIVIEEVVRGCMSTGVILIEQTLAMTPILLAGNEEQKSKHIPLLAKGEKLASFALTEPEAGSDAASISTTALERDGDFIINGRKFFVTLGGEAETYVVFAVTDRNQGAEGISAFIVDKGSPGFKLARKVRKMGMNACTVSEIDFNECIVPRENLLGNLGDGFKIAMMTLDRTRILTAANAVGIAQAAFDCALDYARRRVQFGKPIAEHQAIEIYLAEMATEISAARLLTYQAASLMACARRSTKESSMAKWFGSEMANRVAYKAVQIHGGYGYLKDTPVERYYRDARVLGIVEGTTEIQKLVIAKHLLKESLSGQV